MQGGQILAVLLRPGNCRSPPTRRSPARRRCSAAPPPCPCAGFPALQPHGLEHLWRTATPQAAPSGSRSPQHRDQPPAQVCSCQARRQIARHSAVVCRPNDAALDARRGRVTAQRRLQMLAHAYRFGMPDRRRPPARRCLPLPPASAPPCAGYALTRRARAPAPAARTPAARPAARSTRWAASTSRACLSMARCSNSTSAAAHGPRCAHARMCMHAAHATHARAPCGRMRLVHGRMHPAHGACVAAHPMQMRSTSTQIEQPLQVAGEAGGPGPRVAAGLAAVGSKLYLFGGRTGSLPAAPPPCGPFTATFALAVVQQRSSATELTCWSNNATPTPCHLRRRHRHGRGRA